MGGNAAHVVHVERRALLLIVLPCLTSERRARGDGGSNGDGSIKGLRQTAGPFDGIRQTSFLATLGLPFGALRRAMPSVNASVRPRRWRRALPGVAQTYTVLPATKNLWSSLRVMIR